MPNLPYNNGYWKFNVKNVFNTVCLSSYALKQTPLKFIPSSTKYDTLYSNHYIMWDFGDGSTMQKAYSAEHYFFYPGQYKVTMNIVLSTGEAVLDSYNQIVTIKDFIPNTYSFAPSANDTVLTAGEYSNEIKLERFNSIQSYSDAGYNFFINLSGSNSLYYDKTKLASEPYSFLLPTHRFIQRELVGDMYSDTILDKLSTNSELLYGKLLDTNIHGKNSLVVPASSTDPNAFFVGTSGTGNFHIVDDTENVNNFYAFATLDTTNFPDNYTEYYNYPLDSTLPIKSVNSTYIQISTVQYKDPEKISITSNGLDGEGFELPTFNIALTKYKESPINFVAKLKYNSNYSPKPSCNKLTLANKVSSYRPNGINLSLVAASTAGVPLTALKSDGTIWDGNLSAYTTIDTTLFKEKGYAFLKGSFIIPESLAIDKMCAIKAEGTIISPTNKLFQLSGVSTNFNIYSNKGVNRVAIVNENADMTEILESYAFQPVINQSPELWDPFISTIMGTLSSETNAIGKRLYERTSNFVKNNVNIDTCDLSNLFSYAKEYNVNLNDYATKNLLITYPPDLSRLVNIFSIKKSLLWGRRLQYRTNFKNRYNLNSDTKNRTDAIQDYIDGKTGANNLGKELNNESTLYKEDNHVVAKEIYSSTYKLVPTNIASITLSSYALSTFNDTISAGWGWGLTFPDDLEFGTGDNYSTFYKLSEFYQIYRFNDVVPGKYVGNLINWDDEFQTTIDLKEGISLSSTYTPYFLSSFDSTPLKKWDSTGGIVEQNLSYQISKGLELLSATS